MASSTSNSLPADGAASQISVLRPDSLREQVTRALDAAIVAGELLPGVIYSAPGLAERFGVSATPVREAMLDLVKEGIVELLRNRGFRVIEMSDEDLDNIAQIRLLIEVPTISQPDGGPHRPHSRPVGGTAGPRLTGFSCGHREVTGRGPIDRRQAPRQHKSPQAARSVVNWAFTAPRVPAPGAQSLGVACHLWPSDVPSVTIGAASGARPPLPPVPAEGSSALERPQR